jgi:hypothetical protein
MVEIGQKQRWSGCPRGVRAPAVASVRERERLCSPRGGRLDPDGDCDGIQFLSSAKDSRRTTMCLPRGTAAVWERQPHNNPADRSRPLELP